MSLKDFGRILKIARIQKNLSQRQLADRLGISHVVLSTWERGLYMPSGYCLLGLILALELTPVALRESLGKNK